MTATTLPPVERQKVPPTGPLMRPRAVWADTDVPIVLRLPDIHAPSASEPLIADRARSTQSLPLWLFVLAASLGVVAGLIVLDRWKAYRAANGLKLGPSAVHQPVPTWKVPLTENRGRLNGASAVDAGHGEAAEIATASASNAAGETSRQVQQTAAIAPTPNPAGDELRGSESPKPLNPHFGPRPESVAPQSASPAEPMPGDRRQTRLADRPDVPDSEPQKPPSVAPGVAELEGVIVKPSPRPLYDRARQSLY